MSISRQNQHYIILVLLGMFLMLELCRCSVPRTAEPTEEPPTACESISADAEYVARVLYGLRDYNLTERQKIAVIEVVLNRVADDTREFRTYNTIEEVCNQPDQWQGYKANGAYLFGDYELARARLEDTSGARIVPEGCFFLTIKNNTVTAMTDLRGGNEWRITNA